MFLGAFLAYDTSLDATPIDVGTTEYIEIENAIFDDVFMDSNTSLEYSTEIPEWDYTTVLHAKFHNDILAGNVDFTLASISSLVIKKKKEGSYKWIKLYETNINSPEDFDFFLNDITVASKTNYQYAAVPVTNGVEGSYQITSVYVEFDGAFIIDPTYGYQLIANLSKSNMSRNNPSTILEPINSKYPYVNYYSILQYDRFSVTGMFVNLNKSTCEFDTENSWRLRKEVRDFLINRHSKIVKFYNGEIYMAAVVDNIQESQDGHPDNVTMTINFVEVGDVENSTDLYYHGFIDYLEAGV